MNNQDIIKTYAAMRKLNDICKKLGYNRSNILYGSCTSDKEQIVADIIKCEVAKAYNAIFLGVVDNGNKTNTL